MFQDEEKTINDIIERENLGKIFNKLHNEIGNHRSVIQWLQVSIEDEDYWQCIYIFGIYQASGTPLVHGTQLGGSGTPLVHGTHGGSVGHPLYFAT